MPLTSRQLRDGLCHSSVVVRDVIMDHLTSSFCQDTAVTKSAIGAVEKYGWREVFFWPHRFASLPLSHDTIPWVVAQLDRADTDRPENAICEHLRWMLTRVPLELLANRGAWLLDSVAFSASQRDRIISRLELVGVAPERCWRRLVAFCKRQGRRERTDPTSLEQARILLEPIARAGDAYASRVLDILARPSLPEDDTLGWMTGFMIFLAGEIQLDGAVELVYDKFRLEDDWHAEEALRALSRIASRRMLRLLRNAYRDQAWHVRNYSIGVLEAVHSPNAVQTLLALIDVEDDAFLRGQLGYALAQQLDADTADVARDLYWEAAEDPSCEEIRNALVALSYLDDYDLPERDEWEAKIVAGQLAFQEQCGIGGSKVRLPQA